MSNYYLKQETIDDEPTRKLQFVIRYNKAFNSVSITYPSKADFNTKNTVTISEDLGNRSCTCKTYAVNGECYHTRDGITLLEAAFECANIAE